MNTDEYISGQSLAGRLNISRSAINKAVFALREEGYIITATRNLGYFLTNRPDRLNQGELLRFLPENRIDKISCYSSIVSTNVSLHESAEINGKTGYVILSEEQTSGRGKNGSFYDSPCGNAIYMSYLFTSEDKGGSLKPKTITPRVTEAVCDTISTVLGQEAYVKDIGDIYIGDRKICGIMTEVLVEAETDYVRYAIVGIGVQPDQPGYRVELAANIILALDKLMFLYHNITI